MAIRLPVFYMNKIPGTKGIGEAQRKEFRLRLQEFELIKSIRFCAFSQNLMLFVNITPKNRNLSSHFMLLLQLTGTFLSIAQRIQFSHFYFKL